MNPDGTLNDEEQKLLHHEALIAKIVKIRRGQEDPKPNWIRFFESSGGAALITAVVAGIFGAGITALFQSAAKERDFQADIMKAFNSQHLEIHKTTLMEQTQKTREVLESLGRVITASQNVIDSNGPGFAPRADPSERRLIVGQQKEIRATFNKITDEWGQNENSSGYLLAHYYNGNPSVHGAWEQVSKDVSKYVDCAGSFANQASVSNVSSVCQSEKTALTKSIDGLLATLRTAKGTEFDNFKGFVSQTWDLLQRPSKK